MKDGKWKINKIIRSDIGKRMKCIQNNKRGMTILRRRIQNEIEKNKFDLIE